jgi:TonB family protein
MPVVLTAAAEAAALQPTAKWVMEYNQGDCTLSRRFGEAGRAVTFGLRPSADMQSGELVMLRPDAVPGGVRRGRGRVTLLPERVSFPLDWASGSLAAGKGRGTRLSVEPAFWGKLPAAETIVVEFGEAAPVQLAVGKMTGALQAAKACGDDLLRGFGADPNAMVQPVNGPTWHLFSTDDYPLEAIRNQQGGRVTFLATVTPAGRPLSCTVLASSRFELLDRQTCAIVMQRARFAPVGGDAKRFFSASVRWEVPD